MIPLPPIDGGTTLLTGASSGIGRQLARLLAPRANALALVARRADRLEALAHELREAHPGLTVHVLPCDLADAAAVEALLDRVDREVGLVDILINNAGLGYQATYDQVEWERVRSVLQVTAIATARLSHHFGRQMAARGRGGILNIGSGAGLVMMPGSAAYVGAKHFIDGFTETLRAELRSAGVVVTQAAPGPVVTEFAEAAEMVPLPSGPPLFTRISAAQCAREALRGFEAGRALVLPGGLYRLLMPLFCLLPRPIHRWLGARMVRELRAVKRQSSNARRDA